MRKEADRSKIRKIKVPPDAFALISGLPGEELIAPGLRDLAEGRTSSPEALLILIARSRLTEAGLPFLEALEMAGASPGADSRLYRTLSEKNPETAYGLFNSLRKRLDTFIRSLEQRRR